MFKDSKRKFLRLHDTNSNEVVVINTEFINYINRATANDQTVVNTTDINDDEVEWYVNEQPEKICNMAPGLFVKLHNHEDNTIVAVNIDRIIACEQSEEYSTVFMSGSAEVEVNEKTGKIFNVIAGICPDDCKQENIAKNPEKQSRKVLNENKK